MQSIAMHAKYLDRLFTNIWASTYNLIGDRAVQEIARQLPGIASLDNVTRLVMYIKQQVPDQAASPRCLQRPVFRVPPRPQQQLHGLGAIPSMGGGRCEQCDLAL